MPIVGQKKLFDALVSFREDCLADAGHKLSSFFVLHGGWGVGKSRVGHELCLEAIDENVEWIIEGKPNRVFKPVLEENILPVFIRYEQVTKGRFGEDLSANTWIPATIVEGLSRLAGVKTSSDTGTLSRNQDHLRTWTEDTLQARPGWKACKNQLAESLGDADVHLAAKGALKALKQVGIKHLLFVVDEIEDITDVELDGLESEERTPIDQGLLTVIPRVIKSEEVRQEFPEANFLLLCSRAVGDLLKQVRAIERRTVRHELKSNSFSDVDSLFSYLAATDAGRAIESYPKGLKEAAFFAADRNFGWFNVIMHRLHSNQKSSGSLDTSNLIRQFAENNNNVFDVEAIDSLNLASDDEDNAFIRDTMYGLLPKPIDGPEGIAPSRANRLFEKKDASGTSFFTKLCEIKPPQDVRITTHLVKCGFTVEPGMMVNLPGETRFSLRDVLDSLRTYSQIALPKGSRDNFLICEDQNEFTNQIGALSPYGDRAGEFAIYLHGLLVESLSSNSSEANEYLAPSFAFLQKFHQLNRRQQRVEGYLRDSTKNTKLEYAFSTIGDEPLRRELALLRGIAWSWDQPDRVDLQPVSGCGLPAVEMKSDLSPLNLGPGGASLLLYASKATDTEIEQELARLARRGAEPIVLIVEEPDRRADELRAQIDRAVPKVAPFVVIHQLTRQVGDFLVRLGLMGEAFDYDDMRTNHFNGVIQGARQHLHQVLDSWVTEEVELRGLVLRPLFYGSKVGEDDLLAFTKGYAALLAGKSYHDIKQATSGVFADEAERERFDKMVARQIEPSVKYQGEPMLQLVVEDEGEKKAVLPRCILTLMERCSHVQLKRSELENRFLFEIPAGVKSRDVMRHITTVMHHLGVIELDGEQVRQVSRHMLEHRVKAAEDWLESRFDKAANAIKKIHNEHGTRLFEIHSKDARHGLKRAATELSDLDLDFTGRSWDELNRTSSDGIPVYEQQLRKSLAVIGEVQKNVGRVYDSVADRAFKYSPDVLHEFERQYASPSYPLWKRVRVLQGFYSDLDQRRGELIKRIDAALAEVDMRVPELSDGQKAFPTQAISRPLDAFRQELDFNPERPNRTVTAGGSSLGIVTVGYKLCCDPPKFEEANDRLNEIVAELEHPGKTVAAFNEQLSVWESLRDEVDQVRERMASIESFFADATPEVHSQLGLDEIREGFEAQAYQVNEGGIRDGTDGREAAGEQIWQLVHGLKADIDKLRVRSGDSKKPTLEELLDRMNGLEARAVQALEVRYQEEHGSLMRAWTGIRLATKKNPEPWPREKKKTWAKTKEVFDELVEQMRKDGEEYFGETGDTSFDDYVALCQKQLKGESIDWDSPEYKRHVPGLMSKKLLKLELQ